MFYTLSSRLLVSPNTIFVTDHTTGYFVNVLPDWLIVILSLECYVAICIDWLYLHFYCFVFATHVEVRFHISLIKELIDCDPSRSRTTPISVAPSSGWRHVNTHVTC